MRRKKLGVKPRARSLCGRRCSVMTFHCAVPQGTGFGESMWCGFPLCCTNKKRAVFVCVCGSVYAALLHCLTRGISRSSSIFLKRTSDDCQLLVRD
ncbi:unnamed protein product [Ixodes pacificus]